VRGARIARADALSKHDGRGDRAHHGALEALTLLHNSYTTITDRTPEVLSTIDSLEDVTFDACHNLTNDGIARLARLPRLWRVRASGRHLTMGVGVAFPASVTVHVNPG